jgi:hypothetical protein
MRRYNAAAATTPTASPTVFVVSPALNWATNYSEEPKIFEIE